MKVLVSQDDIVEVSGDADLFFFEVLQPADSIGCGIGEPREDIVQFDADTIFVMTWRGASEIGLGRSVLMQVTSRCHPDSLCDKGCFAGRERTIWLVKSLESKSLSICLRHEEERESGLDRSFDPGSFPARIQITDC